MKLGCLGAISLFACLFIIGGLVGPGNHSPSLSRSVVARSAIDVELDTLLADYKANEVWADATYKGKLIRTTGVLGDIKKDILDNPYVTLGHGRDFEIPEVQCSLASSHEKAAESLRKGQMITVVGSVSGLLMNVQMDDCTF
jgi:hypothetical protein